MRIKFVVIAILLILGSSSAVAAEGKLPLGLSWCSVQSDVLSAYPEAREMTEDVYDISTRVWGVEGFVSLVFDSAQLVGVRIRAFETERDVKLLKTKVEGLYGTGGLRGTTTNWSAGSGQTVQLKLQSEQIFLNFEVATERCEKAEKVEKGPSEQELKDAEALKRKAVLDWDPYADDPEQQVVEKKEKKKEEKKEEKEGEEGDPDYKDGDIDW